MIGGEVVAAAAAFCAASSALVATVLSRSSAQDTVDGEAEMRSVLFEAIDNGDLDLSVVESLTT